MRVVPRPYQLEAAEEALVRNVIVVLPTGAGKTLVAILVAERILGQAENTGKVVILVVSSTAVLVQQAEHIRRDSDLRVAVLSGGVHVGQARAGGAQVLVGTAEVFRRALLPGVQTAVDGQFFVEAPELHPAEICLAVFDEAHHAVKAHPYAELARLLCTPSRSTADELGGTPGVFGADEFHPHPKILGLTASFLHGQLNNLDGKRHMLEDTLHSQLYLPPSHQLPADINRHFFKVIVPRTDGSRQWVSPADVSNITGGILRPLISEIDLEFEAAALLLKEADSGAFIVHDILGVEGWALFLQEALLEIVETKLLMKARYVADSAKLQIEMSVQKLRSLRPRLAEAVGSHYHPGMNGELSPRADALLKILESECCVGGQYGRVQSKPLGPGDSRALERVIVFVERAALCWPLAAIIRKRQASTVELAAMESCRPAAESVAVPVAGVQVMLDGRRSERLAAFRDGRACCAVATASLEEGLDVADCRYVIRFDCFHSVRSHIQGAGRARHPEARVFYFENEPEVEEARAAYVHSATQGGAIAEFRPEAGLGQPPAERLVYSPGMPGSLSVSDPCHSQDVCQISSSAASKAFHNSVEEIGGGHRWGLEETIWDVVANASIRAQRCTSCPAVAQITSRKYGRGRKKTERLFSLHQGPSDCRHECRQ